MNLLVFIFLCILGVVLIAGAVAMSFLETQRKKQVAGILETVAGEVKTVREEPIALVKLPGTESSLQQFLHGQGFVRDLQAQIQQAGTDWDVVQFLGLCMALAMVGVVIGIKFNPFIFPWVSPFATGAILGFLPYANLQMKRKSRMAEFEAQFPEALDFLARSMRSGHALSTSLEMLGAETPDPLGREFRMLFNEQNLGASIEAALSNLARRVPLMDVRFFVSAIMLQRQTGGNLSEILTRSGYVIRERFRLRGAVKAASSHGRITAAVLTVMPFFMIVGLSVVAPTYLRILIDDPDGKYLILAAVISQGLGYFFIRRIINIKV
jgi:tight adherence protein B